MIAQSNAAGKSGIVSVSPKSSGRDPDRRIVSAVFALRDCARGIDAFHVAVLFALLSRLPDVRPSAETIARDARCSRTKVFRVLKELEAWGMVRRTPHTSRDGQPTANSYELDLDAIRGTDGASGGSAEGCPADTTVVSGGHVGVVSAGHPKRQGSEETKQARVGSVQARRKEIRRGGRIDVDPSPGVDCSDAAPPSSCPPTAPSRIDAPRGISPQDKVGVGSKGVVVEAAQESGERSVLPDLFIPEPTIVEREVASLLERAEGGRDRIDSANELVALFAYGCAEAYGSESTAFAELRGPRIWGCAVSAAERTTRDSFGGDVNAAADYVIWIWNRETKARKKGGQRSRPIGWQLMFGRMVEDYPAKERAEAARRRLGASSTVERVEGRPGEEDASERREKAAATARPEAVRTSIRESALAASERRRREADRCGNEVAELLGCCA